MEPADDLVYGALPEPLPLLDGNHSKIWDATLSYLGLFLKVVFSWVQLEENILCNRRSGKTRGRSALTII
jgi:hypothetical protein